MYVQITLTCRRTAEAYDKWRIATWASLRAGYEGLVRQLAQEEQASSFQDQLLVTASPEGPAEINRRIEREELQKWAIKSLRLVPQNLNAIENVGERQEVSPFHAEAEAPIVRFYENAFEWGACELFPLPLPLGAARDLGAAQRDRRWWTRASRRSCRQARRG
ncbi:MAG: hypothetical protein IPH09_12440 [bacterium]|nr:hypothetical protein [bacterium]